MSAIPKGKYPGFDELQKFIHKYVDGSCVSKEISSDLTEARGKLKDSKIEYYQYLYLYTVLKDILLEQNYGVPDLLFEVENKDNMYKLISDLLSSVEAKHCLNISGNPNTTPIEGNLFGLTHDDFDFTGSTKKSMHQTIQQLLIPQVEKQMKSLSLELFRFFNPSNEDSEGLALAKANKFPQVISDEKEKVIDAKKTIVNHEKKYDDVYQEYLNTISEKLNELETEYMDGSDIRHIETNKINIDWLTSKCDFILGKMKVMNNRLYLETYTKEKIEALKKVHYELSKQLKETREEIQKIQKSLKMYESIGDSFTKLLEEYTQLNIEIENKKWALSELKSS